MLVYTSLLLFRICKQEEERRRRGLSSTLHLPKLYHFDLNHEMKAVLLSSHSHQAHTRKCLHPLPIAPTAIVGCARITSAAGFNTAVQHSGRRRDGPNLKRPASILKSQVPAVQRFVLTIMCEKWPRFLEAQR